MNNSGAKDTKMGHQEHRTSTFEDPPPAYESLTETTTVYDEKPTQTRRRSLDSARDLPYTLDHPSRYSTISNPCLPEVSRSYSTTQGPIEETTTLIPAKVHDQQEYQGYEQAIRPSRSQRSGMGSNIVKYPADITMGIHQGLNAIPRFLGDNTQRQPKPVTGAASGFKEAGKELGLGFFNGFTGIVTMPIRGAAQEGVKGFAKGFIQGSLGVVVKPGIAVSGLASYSLKGVHKELQKNKHKADAVGNQYQTDQKTHSTRSLNIASQDYRRLSQDKTGSQKEKQSRYQQFGNDFETNNPPQYYQNQPLDGPSNSPFSRNEYRDQRHSQNNFDSRSRSTVNELSAEVPPAELEGDMRKLGQQPFTHNKAEDFPEYHKSEGADADFLDTLVSSYQSVNQVEPSRSHTSQHRRPSSQMPNELDASQTFHEGQRDIGLQVSGVSNHQMGMSPVSPLHESEMGCDTVASSVSLEDSPNPVLIRDSVALMTDERYSVVLGQGSYAIPISGSRSPVLHPTNRR